MGTCFAFCKLGLVLECLAHSPVDEVLAATVDAGVAAALVHLRQTGGVVVALRAQAGEAINAINARATIVAWVDGTFVNVDVAH